MTVIQSFYEALNFFLEKQEKPCRGHGCGNCKIGVDFGTVLTQIENDLNRGSAIMIPKTNSYFSHSQETGIGSELGRAKDCSGITVGYMSVFGKFKTSGHRGKFEIGEPAVLIAELDLKFKAFAF